jgi:hypothetical protein
MKKLATHGGVALGSVNTDSQCGQRRALALHANSLQGTARRWGLPSFRLSAGTTEKGWSSRDWTLGAWVLQC